MIISILFSINILSRLANRSISYNLIFLIKSLILTKLEIVLLRIMTLYFSVSSLFNKWLPINPVAPVINIVTVRLYQTGLFGNVVRLNYIFLNL